MSRGLGLGLGLGRRRGGAASPTGPTDIFLSHDETTAGSTDTIGTLFAVGGTAPYTFTLVPTGIVLSNDETTDDAEIGDLVGTLTMVGGTAPGVFTLTTNPGGLWQIDGDRLEVAASLAGLGGTEESPVVKVTDALGQIFEATLPITIAESEVGGPAWVPEGALAWADFKGADGYSADGGAITTLLGMWDKDYPDVDSFNPALVVAGTGLTDPGGGASPNLTDVASADLLAGFTAIVLVNTLGGQGTMVVAYDTSFNFEFFGQIKPVGNTSEGGDFNDLIFEFDSLADNNQHQLKLTITPLKMSMCLDGGAVQTGTPIEGAVFQKILVNARGTTAVERVVFMAPQADAVLPGLDISG